MTLTLPRSDPVYPRRYRIEDDRKRGGRKRVTTNQLGYVRIPRPNAPHVSFYSCLIFDEQQESRTREALGWKPEIWIVPRRGFVLISMSLIFDLIPLVVNAEKRKFIADFRCQINVRIPFCGIEIVSFQILNVIDFLRLLQVSLRRDRRTDIFELYGICIFQQLCNSNFVLH